MRKDVVKLNLAYRLQYEEPPPELIALKTVLDCVEQLVAADLGFVAEGGTLTISADDRTFEWAVADHDGGEIASGRSLATLADFLETQFLSPSMEIFLP